MGLTSRVVLAAIDYAEGRPVADAPPSLKVYALSKRLPGLWSGTDLLDAPGQLLAELMAYAGEESRVAAEEAARESRRHGHAGGPRVAGRRR